MTLPELAEAPLRADRRFLLPGDPGFDAAATPWNLAVRQTPAAVAIPRSVEDVVDVVRIASAHGLRIAPQSTGHSAATIAPGDLERAVLLRLHELSGVTVDRDASTARVLGGTLWRDVLAAVAPLGFTALHGSAGDVAVTGYMLGGGLSFYGRRHGLAAHTVRAFDVVTAGGELVRADADHHPSLYWALKGGGGGLGVVVGMEIALLPVTDVVGGMMLWDLDRAPEVLRAWRDWTVSAPESATTSLRFMRFPPLPQLPAFLSGRRVVIVDGAVLEADDRAAAILEPLRALTPELDTFARIPARALLDVHMDPPGPTPALGDHAVLDELPDAAIDALLEVAGPRADVPLMVAELRHLGGQLAVPRHAAMSAVQGEYAVLAIAAVPDPAMASSALALTASVVDAVRPWAGARPFFNFAERPTDPAAMHAPDTWERLRRVRAMYDPLRMFVGAHPLRAPEMS